MALPNPDKSFEIDNGIVLMEGGPGNYAGTGSPVGLDVIKGSIYSNKDDASLWWKYGPTINDWKKIFDAAKNQGVDHNNLFVSEAGKLVVSGVYALVNQNNAGGDDAYLPNTIFTFAVVGEALATLTVRIWDAVAGMELAEIVFDTPGRQLKTVNFLFSGGETIVETQAKKTGGSARVYASTIIAAG